MSQTQAHPWLQRIIDAPVLARAVAGLAGPKRVVAQGACGSSTTLLAGALAVRQHSLVLLVVAHLDDADDAVEDLELFREAGHTLEIRRFGALEVMPGESGVSLELLAERLALLEWLQSQPHIGQQSGVIVAPIQALMQGVPEPQALSRFQLSLRVGQSLNPAALLDWLDRAGYTRGETIEQPGDFATRGGIVDIFLPSASVERIEPDKGPALALGSPLPVRIDYFGDEIDSLREIDTDTMGSGPALKWVRLIGASPQALQSDDETTSLTQLLPPEVAVVLTEVMELSEQARGYYERLSNPRGIYSPQAVLQGLTRRPYLQVNQYSKSPGEETLEIPVRPLPAFDQEAAKAVAELCEQSGSHQVVALCQKQGEVDRLHEMLRERGGATAEKVAVEAGYLHRGLIWDETATDGAQAAGLPLLLTPHHELFHRYQARRRIRRIGFQGPRGAEAFLDLQAGDFVVHIEHGIARFVGLKTMRPGRGQEQAPAQCEEYLTLEFANRVLLHVPATQIELVQRYVGGFQGKPPLSLLGGKRWAKQKEAVAESVKDLAAEMLRIQAARASMPGIRYPADTTWQREFEAEFPYEETDDQLAAIAQVKADMADEQPMDRLICGDVGFGKTEVAIRAAFKAVEFGKQVAVLVPTTVLAEQHERTFRGRMADYPFIVASLSRFKSAAEQKAILQKVAQKRVDIIIGTHRLLSSDVRFADLGLVIIDEEQRFGVEHKQKLLQFRLTCDVLTLSATPIPRTLHMAMLGLRNISSLSTPPMDRRAIVTEVLPFDRKRVAQAIVRELNRDGQIFFVHNRVHDIQSVADDVQALAPQARIAIGHGQMAGHDLEKVMLRFTRRQADILVCTTIIESGIDIPTANTIIIDQADQFGLADLHQLRGRVGRYKHRAYCYLLLPENRPVTDTATRRLRAIEQYSMLGAGFKIAMRDLEIRGAGNLLGAEQSGHIAAVGYEMYCQLLEHEAATLRHEKPRLQPAHTHLELPIPQSGCRIPAAYITSEKQRMEAYRRLGRCVTVEELETVLQDLVHAYGNAPEPLKTLADLTQLRIAAAMWGIESIKLEGPDLIFRSSELKELDPVFQGAPGRMSVLDDKTIYYRPPASYLSPPQTLLAVLRKLLIRPRQGGGEKKPGNTAGTSAVTAG